MFDYNDKFYFLKVDRLLDIFSVVIPFLISGIL